MSFLPDELQRYSRHFNLPQIGQAGQKKLKAARVLCVGAGGLGSPLLFYLAGAGVGSLGIIDHDAVETSNLQRQILFDTNQIGQNKATAAKEKLQQYNPHIDIQPYPIALTEKNALEILTNYDLIADCTDNFSSRYLINDACCALKKPNISASISQFTGYCSVFCTKEGPCYRCLFPNPPPADLIPNCAEQGVLGVLPGLLGTLQANEILKLILGIGEPLIGQLLTIDALSLQFNHFKITQSPDCPLCSQQKTFSTIGRPMNNSSCSHSDVESITVTELKALKESVFLLDVREPDEHAAFNIGGALIPLAELTQRQHEIPSDKPIVAYCQSGRRSERAVQILKAAGINNVKNLQGGMQAWIHDTTEENE